MSILLSAELEVDGDLKVTGTIQNDSLAQVIAQLEARIAQLECTNSGNIPAGYCDCFGNTLDICGVCNGDAISEDECMLTDIDGNTYETVEIGNQVWMAENLKVTRYRNGAEMPIGSSNGDALEGAYRPYDDDFSNSETYGYFYNWYAVDDIRELCMEGWHVSSDAEWIELELFLGMSEEEAYSTAWRGDKGSKLASNADLWHDGLLENDSEFGASGFNALPAGGSVIWGNSFGGINSMAYFWTSTSSDVDPWNHVLHHNYLGIDRNNWHNENTGMSVRCIKD